MTTSDWRLALRLARRELRSGLRGFGVFLGCLFLGVFAISTVGSLGRALEGGMNRDAKSLHGGDVGISVTSRELDSAALDGLRTLGTLSETLTTRTMARTAEDANPQSVLVELKGVDTEYPLYGRMELENGADLQLLLAERHGLPGAVAAPELLSRLGVQPGDSILIGNVRFELRGVIGREPDRVVAFFSLGPRVMVSLDGFRQTGLLQPGSLYSAGYQLRLPGGDAEKVAEGIRTAHPDSGWRVRDYTHAAPRIRTTLERMRVNLTLVGLAALLVGGLGIAGGVRGYLEGRLTHMAAMKCMGGSVRVLFASYLLQVLVLGALGALAGMLAGALVPVLVRQFFVEVLPIDLQTGFYVGPLLQAALFGLVTTVAFALPPLIRAVTVPPSGIFRGYVSADSRSMPRAAMLPVALTFAVLAGMVFVFAGNPRLAAWFVLGTIGAWGLFTVLARIIRWLAGHAPRLPWAAMRLGLANIHRPGAPGVSMVFALGFGLTALVAVVMVNTSLTRTLSSELAQDAPVYFFMDIRPEEVDGIRQLAHRSDGIERVDLRPMIRARIVSIAGVPVENATVSEDVEWAVRGDRGLSYSRDFPAGSTLVKGQWWDAAYSGPPLISLTADLARGFGVDVGDTLTVNVLGRNITGTIASLREVNWQSLAMQFAIIFSPGVLDHAPQTWLGAVYGTDPHETLFRGVTGSYPDVAVVTIRDVLDTATATMQRTVLVFQAMAGVALVVGLLVLAGSFSADQHRRIYDCVLYKVCGATRGDILGILVAEFSLAGLFTGIGSLVLGTLTAWGVVQGLMRMAFVPDYLIGLGTVAGGVLVSLAVGLLGTWRALGQKAAPHLRNE